MRLTCPILLEKVSARAHGVAGSDESSTTLGGLSRRILARRGSAETSVAGWSSMSHRPEWLFTTCFVERRGPRPLARWVRSGVHEHVHHIHTTVLHTSCFPWNVPTAARVVARLATSILGGSVPTTTIPLSIYVYAITSNNKGFR
jgi:hypothetical protein